MMLNKQTNKEDSSIQTIKIKINNYRVTIKLSNYEKKNISKMCLINFKCQNIYKNDIIMLYV